MKTLSLFLGLFLSIQLTAQIAASSGNGKMLVDAVSLGRNKATGQETIQLRAYSVPYNTLVKSFEVGYKSISNIDSLVVSHTGKMLYIKAKDDHRVYNARTGQLLFRSNEKVVIALANEDNFFMVAGSNQAVAFDAYTGEVLVEYEVSANNQIKHIEVAQDDEHIAAISNKKQVYFWQTSKARARKKFYGNDFVLKADGRGFTLTRESGSNLNVFTYDLPNFKRKKNLSVSKVLRDHAREQTLLLRKSDPSKRSSILQASKLLPGENLLSQSGKYTAAIAKSPNNEKELFVLDNLTGEVITQKVVGSIKKHIALNWFNDSLLVPQNAMQAEVFNANKKEFDKQLNFEFLFTKSTSAPNARRQISTRSISPNFRFVTVPSTDENMLLKNTKSGLEAELKNHVFLEFSHEKNLAFVRNSINNRRGYVKLSEFEKNKKLVIYYFGDTERPLTEEAVLTEFENPDGFQTNRITDFKHISEAKPEDSIQVVMKTVETGEKAGVQIQLIDKNGVYYYGAGSDYFKKVWCNLMVKGSNGRVDQIDNFKVTEYRHADTLPNAIAVVMDFSGSMGWPRADKLQEGVENFLKAKKEKDEIALLKYDHHIVKESDLQDKTDKLIRKLYKTDYSEFGGSTALLDAINAGIFTVKNARNVGKKIVILMTDGMENASVATKNEVLVNALENGVNVFTVGFGDMVNQGYLKSISYNTKGGHYQLFDTKDFGWVYNDIYNKALNYYSVNYHTPDKGSQVYMLKVCLDGVKADSLVVQFENTPADIKLLQKTDEDFQESPVQYDKIEDIDLKDFSFAEIKDFSKIGVDQPSVPKKIKVEEDKLSEIEAEFEIMELPRFNFYYDEIQTVQETERQIANLALFLLKYPDIELEIIGHTDNSGEIDYNDALSKDRAAKVKKMIVDKGVPAKRLYAKGYGETAPINSNDTEEGRAKNRRVEFRIK